MAMSEKSIISSGTNLKDVACKLLDYIIDDDKELLTLITGESADKEITDNIVEYIEDKYDVEVDLIEGDVPVYYYLIGLE